MLARTKVQSRWWRLFTIAAVVIAAPILLRAGSTTEWLRSAAGAIALVGLIGYAFGFRVGPPLFWRVFSVPFAIGLMLRLGQKAAPALQDFPNSIGNGANRPLVIVLGFTFLWALCLALFRHAGLVPSPAGTKPGSVPEPLFSPSSRKERWVRAQQAMAEARAEIERPMPPAMKAEAQSLGDRRQLTLEQHRRITSFLLFGVIAMQAAVAIPYGIMPSILFATIVLLIGGAMATYCSAEMILKAQARLLKSWKAVVLLIALSAALFLVRDSGSPMLWLLRVLLTDITALVLGNLLVSSLHALSRSR